MSLTSPSLLSSPLPSRGALVFNKPSASSLAVSTARRGVRVVAEAAAVSSPASSVSAQRTQPSAAEVARTVVELAPSGTLSVVGADEFRQSGARTPQCTFLGALTKPSDKYELKWSADPGEHGGCKGPLPTERKSTTMCGGVAFITQVAYGVTVASTPVAKLSTRWETKFGEEIDEDRLYLISVERILHMEDFNEISLLRPNPIWVATGLRFSLASRRTIGRELLPLDG
ncbi:hypothetical protein TRIUR3_19082 [Triticum urartu]|uniref:Uncharacterized protein n=1 Tax=Triticum urartu TaxID=4572 RepID=M8A3Q2_TRIUA|nr:hypothetical protein TRIUR3_19082 [Triticum urartu]